MHLHSFPEILGAEVLPVKNADAGFIIFFVMGESFMGPHILRARMLLPQLLWLR